MEMETSSDANDSVIPLSAKEKVILEFIEEYLGSNGIAPTFTEIQTHFGFASINSVQNYVKQLQRKRYVSIPAGNQKRAIMVLQSAGKVQDQLQRMRPTPPAPLNPQSEAYSLPLLGRVAAGLPLEAFEHDEFIDVPKSMVTSPSKSYALRVVGQSMIEDGILDGDVVIIEKRVNPQNGDIVVASVDNESTVKRFYLHKSIDPDTPFQKLQVELRPANSSMTSMWFSPEKVLIQGVVVGLLRKF